MNQHDVTKSIAYCGLVCALCHEGATCDGCRQGQGRCASKDGCFQYNCCRKKGIQGCWECADAPCGKDMFSREHDRRLRAFVRCAKEEGLEKLGTYIFKNQICGIQYGYDKDYDHLSSEEEVLQLLRTGKKAIKG